MSYLHVFGTKPTFEISHVGPHIRVQGIDDHFSVSRACDLHSAVDEAWCRLCTPPCGILADMPRLWEEVGEVSFVELGLSEHAPLQ